MPQIAEGARASRLSRRRFLTGAAALAGGATIVACAKPDRESQVQSFVLSPEQSLPGQELWFATAAAHSVGWNSAVVRVIDGRAKKVEGNPAFPINQGKLDVRGQAGVQSLYHPDRLQTPLKRRGVRGGGDYEAIDWDEALDTLVARLEGASSLLMLTPPLAGTRARLASDFAAVFGGRQLVYEPLENTTLREALRLSFGTDRIPHFDIANARSVLSFGADFLGTWVSPTQYSVAYGEMRQGAGRERGLLIQVEPRMSLTGASADRWVPVKPGQEGVLALSIAQVIAAEGLTGDDRWYDVVNEVGGLAALNEYAPDRVSQRTGIEAETIQLVARDFAAHQPGIALAGGPALAHTNGLDIGAAVFLLNRMVGSVGVPGGVLPNPPAPAEIPAPQPASPFREWAGLAASLRDGDTPDMVFVHEANPVYGLPASIKFSEALGKVPFIVGTGVFMNETLAHADLVLPAAHTFEEWGDFAAEPGAGSQVVGHQQPVVTPWTKSRSFGDVLLTAWHEVKPETAPPWETMREAVRSTAESVFAEQGQDFARAWIELLRNGGKWDRQAPRETLSEPDWHVGLLNEPAYAGDSLEFPLHLVPFETVALGTGDEAVNPWLQATPDPLTTVTWITWVELNPRTAADLGVKRGDVVKIETPAGSIEGRVYESPVTPPDVVGVPVGQGHEFGGRWVEQRGANVLPIVQAQIVSGSGALAWAATRARVRGTGGFERLPTFEVIDSPRNDGAEPIARVTSE